MIKMKMLPAVLNQLLPLKTFNHFDTTSIICDELTSIIIHKHDFLKAKLIQNLPVVTFTRSHSLPRYPHGISDNDQSFSEAVNLKMLKRKTLKTHPTK